MALPEFKLPDPDEQDTTATENDKFEVEIEDDTPKEDRRRDRKSTRLNSSHT